MPQIMQFSGGATLGRSGQYANRSTPTVDPLPGRQAPMCRARGQSDTDRKVGNRMLLGFSGESARGRKRKLTDSLQLPPIKGIWPPQNLHRILRPTHLGEVSFGAWVAPSQASKRNSLSHLGPSHRGVLDQLPFPRRPDTPNAFSELVEGSYQ
jgi:hypothetical protein